MTQNKKKQTSGPASANGSRRIWFLVVVAVVVVVAGWLLLEKRSADTVSPAQIATLTGRWLRPDGGYVIDIRGVDSSGKRQVAYFNPRPINVSQAVAVATPDGLEVFVELRDKGYPGATYTLVYDEQRDVLQGLYYQPAVGETFQVVFIREPGRNQ
jgi:hypothetical protein